MSPFTTPSLLHRVARLHEVQCSYRNAFGKLVHSPPEAILSVLRILAVPAESMHDLSDAFRQRRQQLWRRSMEPVLIAWDGALNFTLRLPVEHAESRVNYEIVLESGELLSGVCRELHTRSVTPEIEGTPYVKRRLAVPIHVPLGYHSIRVQFGFVSREAHLISSLLRTYTPADERQRWGVFCPLYALHSERSWGAGDLSDLSALLEFVAQTGGDVVGTLPLLPAFLDEPFNPSPYAPVSRRFWNEFYLDVPRIAEFDDCQGAQAVMQSSDFQAELASIRQMRFIDYRRSMSMKRRVLEDLLRCLLKRQSTRRDGFARFVESQPSVQDYAAFRAKIERERKVWQLWPASARDGALTPSDFDDEARQYHLYVQWQCHEQMHQLSGQARVAGAKLYLDFPLGVNRDGYDVWREPSAFALHASGGAPPDGFFSKGQDWGFPPPHPDGLREQGYRHYAECLRHHMQVAGMLRVDHILGLHRLYWVPEGFAPNQGVYVHYRAEEFYAVLSLESHRHQVQIVGENLGTVPAYVYAAMARHDVIGMRVGQFSVQPDPQKALEETPPKTIVSLNTHDTPTFAGFWQGSDIQDRIDLGLLNESESVEERQYRAAQREALVRFLEKAGRLHGGISELSDSEIAILKGWLSHLAAGNADLLLVNLEDLWLEPLPQNVPGTWDERPNWQRTARLTLEAIRRSSSVNEILTSINGLRRTRSSGAR